MKTLDEIAKEYANKPPIIIDIEIFREDLKDLLCDADFLRVAHEKVLQNNKEYFNNDTEKKGLLSGVFKTWEDEEKVLKEVSDRIIEGLEDYKNTDLNSYDDLLSLYIDTTPLEEYTILNTALRTTFPVLRIITESEVQAIFNLLDRYYGEDIASFISGVSVMADKIDRRKLPKWVLKNYRYIIEEVERLLTRMYTIESTVINAVANSVPISKEIEEVAEKQDGRKRAYTFHDDTAQYSLSELSKALTTQDKNQLTVKERDLNLQVLLSGTEESEQQIRKLSPFEKKVLDTIIKFFIERKYEFTDHDIARQIYGAEDRENNIYTKPTETQLQGINRAIKKIRTTMIEVKGESKKRDEFYNSQNPIIDVFNEGRRDANSNTQYYTMNSVPFYYTYISMTGGQFVEYDNRAFTKQIDGIKKTEKAQSLRIYITEKISNICMGYDVPYIDVKEILNLEGINAETRKQKHDVLKTIAVYLDELKEQYRFESVEDKKGKTLKGYIIKVNMAR